MSTLNEYLAQKRTAFHALQERTRRPYFTPREIRARVRAEGRSGLRRIRVAAQRRRRPRAIQAVGDGEYRQVVQLIRPVRTVAHRFGGSHAQRDVIDLTLIEAAFRAGERDLAMALAVERVGAKPASPLAALFAQRAAS
jgi:hypothetical protein